MTTNIIIQDLTLDEQLGTLGGADGDVGQCTRVEAFFQEIGGHIRGILREYAKDIADNYSGAS